MADFKNTVVKVDVFPRCDGKGGLSSKTISDIIVILNSIFDYACKQYQYPNPIKDLKRTFRAKRADSILVRRPMLLKRAA